MRPNELALTCKGRDDKVVVGAPASTALAGSTPSYAADSERQARALRSSKMPDHPAGRARPPAMSNVTARQSLDGTSAAPHFMPTRLERCWTRSSSCLAFPMICVS